MISIPASDKGLECVPCCRSLFFFFVTMDVSSVMHGEVFFSLVYFAGEVHKNFYSPLLFSFSRLPIEIESWEMVSEVVVVGW